MRKYMIVFWIGADDPQAVFVDTYQDAEQTRMSIECGAGGYAEVYERLNGEYVFLFS